MISNKSFAMLYINMVFCECFNMIGFIIWAAPIMIL